MPFPACPTTTSHLLSATPTAEPPGELFNAHSRTFQAVDEYREVELTRLDALQSACWDAALAGDLRAISAALRVIEQRCRLLGLEGEKATQEGNGGLLVQPPQPSG